MTHDWIVFGAGVINAVVGYSVVRLIRWREDVDAKLAHHTRKFDKIAAQCGLDLSLDD